MADMDCCCTACTVTTVVVLVLGAASTLFADKALAVDEEIDSSPRDPHFFVDQPSLSGYNLTAGNDLTSTFNLLVSAYNPNSKYIIYYDIMMVSVYANGTLLAYQVLPDPFTQHPKARVSFQTAPAARNVSLSDGSEAAANATVSGIRTAASTAGTANLEVRVRAQTRFRYKGWKRFHHMMKAVCSPVPVKFNSSTEASGVQQHVVMSMSIDFFFSFFFCV